MTRRWRCGGMALVGAVLSGACSVPGFAEVLPCPDSDLGSVARDAAGLYMVTAATPALQTGDRLLQLNSHHLLLCSDLSDALREARDRNLARLFLVRRGTETIAVAFEARPQPVAVAAAPAAIASETPAAALPATAVPPPPPPTPVPTVAPRTLSQSDVEAVQALLARYLAFARELQGRLPVPTAQPWVRRIDELRRDLKQLQFRGIAVGAIDAFVGYFDTIADILQYRDAATQGRRELRARAEVVLEYDSSTPVRGWLEHYPFLRPSVLQEPEPVKLVVEGERKGRWSADQAISLLVERALAEGPGIHAKLTAE